MYHSRSSPVVQCIASNTTEIGVVSSNPGGRKHKGLFSRKTPIIAESAGKQNSTRVDEGRKC